MKKTNILFTLAATMILGGTLASCNQVDNIEQNPTNQIGEKEETKEEYSWDDVKIHTLVGLDLRDTLKPKLSFVVETDWATNAYIEGSVISDYVVQDHTDNPNMPIPAYIHANGKFDNDITRDDENYRKKVYISESEPVLNDYEYNITLTIPELGTKDFSGKGTVSDIVWNKELYDISTNAGFNDYKGYDEVKFEFDNHLDGSIEIYGTMFSSKGIINLLDKTEDSHLETVFIPFEYDNYALQFDLELEGIGKKSFVSVNRQWKYN